MSSLVIRENYLPDHIEGKVRYLELVRDLSYDLYSTGGVGLDNVDLWASEKESNCRERLFNHALKNGYGVMWVMNSDGSWRACVPKSRRVYGDSTSVGLFEEG